MKEVVQLPVYIPAHGSPDTFFVFWNERIWQFRQDNCRPLTDGQEAIFIVESKHCGIDRAKQVLPS